MISDEALEAVELVIQQVKILFVFLARPIVQRELLALFTIFVVSWVLSAGLRRWQKKRYMAAKADGGKAARYRWMRSFSLAYAPIFALVLLVLVEWSFGKLGHPSGLLVASETIAWAWLTYRLLLALLYHRYGEAMRPFHHWLLLPLFL